MIIFWGKFAFFGHKLRKDTGLKYNGIWRPNPYDQILQPVWDCCSSRIKDEEIFLFPIPSSLLTYSGFQLNEVQYFFSLPYSLFPIP